MISIPVPLAPLLGGMFVLTRVSFLIAFMPIFGDRATPLRIRALLAFALTLLLTPVYGSKLAAFPDSVPALIFALLPEALIGFTLGLLGRMIFGAIQFGGQIAGREMGFAMANEIDPSTGIPIAVVGQLQYGMSVLLFFHTGAYVLFFQALGQSFDLIPPFQARATESLFELVRQASAQMFLLGVRLNFPVIGTLMAVNVTFALLAKAVPNLNLLIESFPIRILAGLTVLALTVGLVAILMKDMFQLMDWQLYEALKLMAPAR